MTSLPTAHASQRFGAREIDFYAAPGLVVGSDPRGRADERRIQDTDGARHTVRLAEPDFVLEPGDAACVLRLQPGPARRSRPVAVVNYETQRWSRTHPCGHALLARIGVARDINWALSIAVLVGVIMLALYPAARALISTAAPQLGALAPGFDVFALAASAVPALADFRVAAVLGGAPEALAALVPALAERAEIALLAGATLAGGVFTFWSRSWRLLWVPALVAAVGAAGMGLSGPAGAAGPVAGLLAIVASVFLIGGGVNRWRDAARFDGRIARLADHLLRQRPEEFVSPARDGETASAAEADAETQTEAAASRQDGAAIAAREAGRAAASTGEGEDDPRRARDITLPPPPPMPTSLRAPDGPEGQDATETGDARAEGFGEAEAADEVAEAHAPEELADGAAQTAAESGAVEKAGMSRAADRTESDQTDSDQTEAGETQAEDTQADAAQVEDIKPEAGADREPEDGEFEDGAASAKPAQSTDRVDVEKADADAADDAASITGAASGDGAGDGPDDASPAPRNAAITPPLGAPPAWSLAALPDNVVAIFAAAPPDTPPAPPRPDDQTDHDDRR